MRQLTIRTSLELALEAAEIEAVIHKAARALGRFRGRSPARYEAIRDRDGPLGSECLETQALADRLQALSGASRGRGWRTMPLDEIVDSEAALEALGRPPPPPESYHLPQGAGIYGLSSDLLAGLSQSVATFARRELARAHGIKEP